VRWRFHKTVHERFPSRYNPAIGYFGCRICDQEWDEAHPEEAVGEGFRTGDRRSRFEFDE
jgi:hypothetical protein